MSALTADKKMPPHRLQPAEGVVQTSTNKENATMVSRGIRAVESRHVEHHAWCDAAKCITDADEDGTYVFHYGSRTALAIDTTNTIPWRCTPSGHPEVTVCPIDFDTHPGVELNCGDLRNSQSTSGQIGVSWLTTAEARNLAVILWHAADQTDGVRVPDPGIRDLMRSLHAPADERPVTS